MAHVSHCRAAFFSAGLAAVGFLLAFGARAGERGWPHDAGDLAPDPRVTWGILDNGVRYAVRPHNEPPGRVSLRLLVEAGSLMEEDHERGLAHFVEHMAFNGTKHFDPGEMVKYFQRLGMAFGADTNAHTTFSHTGYQIDLPSNEHDLLDKGLLLFRDYAGEMTMAQEQIDKERGVILSEKRTRNTASYRTFRERLGFLLPQSLLSRRHPIGTEDVIRTASREHLMDFYRTWYIPQRLTVVAVGDIDPAAVIELVGKHFQDMTAAQDPPPDPDLGVDDAAGLKAAMYREPDAPAVTVSIHTLFPHDPRPDDRQYRIMQLRRAAVHQIISRRLDILAEQDDAPFSEGVAYAYDWHDFVTIGTVELKTDEERWRDTLRVAETELRRALTHGFLPSEIAQETSALLTRFRQAAATASTRSTRRIADDLLRTVSRNRVYTDPDADLELAAEALDRLTPEAALDALKRTWNASDSRYVFVAGDLDEPSGEVEILDIYRENRKQAVSPPAERQVRQFAYADFGSPGAVAARTDIGDLGITRLQFENRAYVNLKPTEFEAETVRVAFRVGAGKLAVPDDKPGLIALANEAFVHGGLGRHSWTELQRLFAAKNVSVSFRVEDDAFVLAGETSREDLADQLAVMTAYLVDPGYREEALRLARQHLDNTYRTLRRTPYGVFQDRIVRFLAGGDPRFGYPPRAAVMQLDLSDLQEWLKPPLREGLLEVSLVGDFDAAEATELLAATVGALPPRAAARNTPEEARNVEFPRHADRQIMQYQTVEPKALVCVFWPTTDMWDISATRRINVLSRVLRDRIRIKIREETGETYSPQVFSYQSDTFPGYGYLAVLVIADPAQDEWIAKLVRDIGADLNENGASEDEVMRARQPILAGLDEQLRRNQYWLHTVLMGSTQNPVRIEWARTIRGEYSQINRLQVNQTAAEFLTPVTAVQVLVRPIEIESDEAADQPAAAY